MFTRSSPLSLFPVYLFPPVPFRRRPISADSTGLTSLKNEYLAGHNSHIRCAKCATDVCLTSQIISKGFTGRHGRAYLVSPSSNFSPTSPPEHPSKDQCLSNTKTESPSQRQLVTGIHTVSDVRCAICGSMLGWKYDGAEEESQRYKVGKYILETKMICSSSNWELDDPDLPLVASDDGFQQNVNEPVSFDSQDEDECEDLFAGVWSPGLALKRRQNKSFRRSTAGAAR